MAERIGRRERLAIKASTCDPVIPRSSGATGVASPPLAKESAIWDAFGETPSMWRLTERLSLGALRRGGT